MTKSYWFWVMGSKVMVNFGSLFIKPCRYDTDYSLSPIFFKLHTTVWVQFFFQTSHVSCWWFWVKGQGQFCPPPPCKGMPCFAFSSHTYNTCTYDLSCSHWALYNQSSRQSRIQWLWHLWLELLLCPWRWHLGLAKIRWPFHFKWCYINVILKSNNQLWWYILHCRDQKIGFPVIYNIIMLHVFIYVYLKNKGTKNGLFWLLCCCT